MTRITQAMLLAAFCVFAAGCGGGGSSGSVTPPPPGPTATPVPTTAPTASPTTAPSSNSVKVYMTESSPGSANTDINVFVDFSGSTVISTLQSNSGSGTAVFLGTTGVSANNFAASQYTSAGGSFLTGPPWAMTGDIAGTFTFHQNGSNTISAPSPPVCLNLYYSNGQPVLQVTWQWSDGTKGDSALPPAGTPAPPSGPTNSCVDL